MASSLAKLPFYRRFNGNTRAASGAHTLQQLFTLTAQTFIADWLIFLSETGLGIDKQGLRARIKQTK